MIKLGVCTGIENAGALAQIGFDYIETGLSAIAAMPGEEFRRAKNTLLESSLPCEAMNGMVPGEIPLTGPRADLSRAGDYLSQAFSRARELGARVIVFGSGASRQVPEGFPYGKAFRQLGDFLALADGLAGENGLRIAIEPLRHEECNILHFVSEALILASLLHLPHVGVLGDTYHMAAGNEPFSALQEAGELLWHVHMARPQSRAYPSGQDPEEDRQGYAALFSTLRAMGYEGRVSVEGQCTSFLPDAKASFQLLHSLRA